MTVIYIKEHAIENGNEQFEKKQNIKKFVEQIFYIIAIPYVTIQHLITFKILIGS